MNAETLEAPIKKDSYYWRNREKVLAKSKEQREIRAKQKDNYNAEARAKRCAYMQAYYKKDPDRLAKRKIYLLEYHSKNRLRLSESQKKYSAAYARERRLMREYGMTQEQYLALLKKQNFTCAICRRPERKRHFKTGKLSPLNVDHCHETGKGRGLLCTRCNATLGIVEAWTRIYQVDIFAYLQGEVLTG